MQRTHAGFTLIEAVVTLAVAAICLTLGLPAFGGALERQRVQSAMHLLSADLAMARGTAVMRRQQVVLCPGDAAGCRASSDWAGGWVVFTDADQNRRIEAADDLLRVEGPVGGASSGLRMASTRGFARYQADGRSAHSNLTIHVCTGSGEQGKVVLNNLGRVRTERSRSGLPCPTAGAASAP